MGAAGAPGLVGFSGGTGPGRPFRFHGRLHSPQALQGCNREGRWQDVQRGWGPTRNPSALKCAWPHGVHALAPRHRYGALAKELAAVLSSACNQVHATKKARREPIWMPLWVLSSYARILPWLSCIYSIASCAAQDGGRHRGVVPPVGVEPVCRGGKGG